MNELAQVVRCVPPGSENVFDIIRQAGDSPKLRVEFTQLIAPTPAPVRAESPRRHHLFNTVEGFSAYLSKYGSQNVVVLADVGAQQITAVLDETADKGRELVALRPMLHPVFLPWAGLLNMSPMGEASHGCAELTRFADFIRQNRRVIAEPDPVDLAAKMSQIRVSTEIAVQKGKGARSTNGIVVTQTIQGVIKSEPVDLPDSIKIVLPIYVSSSPRTLEIDLLVEGNHDGTEVVANVSCAGLTEALMQEFAQMIAQVQQAVGGTVALGTCQYSGWNYVGNPSGDTTFDNQPAPRSRRS